MNTPALEELNFDSIGLMRVLTMFGNRKNLDDSTGGMEFRRLTDTEVEKQFRSSTLIQKIIKKYPYEAKQIGYELINDAGDVVESNNDLFLEAVKEASIFSRLYSRAYLYLEFDDNKRFDKPVRKESQLIGYKILFDIRQEGDYFIVEQEQVHYQRIIEFIGVRTYSKYCRNDDIEYSDSVLQGLYNSLVDYVTNNSNAKKILENLAYLTIGIDNLGNMSKSDEGRAMIFDRLTTLNMNRSINRVIAFDKKSEEVGFITQTLNGVKDIIEEIKVIFISETDYPAEELFEQSPGQKLGSGIQNQLVSRYLWARRCRNWTINNWMPYYQIYFNRIRNMENIKIRIPFIVDLTDEEKANIENIGADRTKKLIDAGVIDAGEARTGYQGNKYTLNIRLNEETFKQKSSALTETKQTQAKINQTDSVDDNLFWDAISRVTEQDLEDIAKGVLE